MEVQDEEVQRIVDQNEKPATWNPSNLPPFVIEATGRQVVLDPSLTVDSDGKYFDVSTTSSHLVVLRVPDAYAATHHFVINKLVPPQSEIRALVQKHRGQS